MRVFVRGLDSCTVAADVGSRDWNEDRQGALQGNLEQLMEAVQVSYEGVWVYKKERAIPVARYGQNARGNCGMRPRKCRALVMLSDMLA